MKDQITLGIAEDHTIVRSGLISLLKNYNRVKVIFDVANGQELLEKLRTVKPDIILLDIQMSVMSGKEALIQIKRKYPKVKIIIMTAFSDDMTIIEYIKKGVNSFLPKDCKIDLLVEAIYAVHERGTYFDQKVSTVLAKELADPASGAPDDNELSKQDKTIIKLICENKTSKEIADILSLSQKTIEFHRSKILSRTGSKNVAALVTYAHKNKLNK